jgi:glycogen phosphorylase
MSLACLDCGLSGEVVVMQTIDAQGNQYEVPDIWLTNGNPWELRRDDIVFPVNFFGEVVNGKWTPGEVVS